MFYCGLIILAAGVSPSSPSKNLVLRVDFAAPGSSYNGARVHIQPTPAGGPGS